MKTFSSRACRRSGNGSVVRAPDASDPVLLALNERDLSVPLHMRIRRMLRESLRCLPVRTQFLVKFFPTFLWKEDSRAFEFHAAPGSRNRRRQPA
jgi:hypothetical protein